MSATAPLTLSLVPVGAHFHIAWMCKGVTDTFLGEETRWVKRRSKPLLRADREQWIATKAVMPFIDSQETGNGFLFYDKMNAEKALTAAKEALAKEFPSVES